MDALIQILTADQKLLAGIALALDEAARRSGRWLACRSGCTPCCHGPFAISALDALRLSEGLAALGESDPARAEKVRMRAAEYIARVAAEFPGDLTTGVLSDADALPDSMDDVPCPVLDPETGLCDLYEARPVTCRAFGPATRLSDHSVGACELCYEGATSKEIENCAVEIDPEGEEHAILSELESRGVSGETIVAYALLPPKDSPLSAAMA